MNNLQTNKPLTLENQVLAATGALSLVLAAIFGWRELSLDARLLLAVAAVSCALMCLLKRPQWVERGAQGLAACAVAGGVWFALSPSNILLGCVLVTFASAVVALVVGRRRALPLGQIWLWMAAAAAFLGASLASYFNFLTLEDVSVARRLVLSGGWLLVGLVVMILSRNLRDCGVRSAGLTLLLAAAAKVLLYDTTHLHSWLRIAALLASGVVLVGASLLVRRSQVKGVHA